MKKIVLLAILLLSFAVRAEAITELSKTYVSSNTTAGTVSTTVLTTTIIPGVHKIIGYKVVPVQGSGAGAWATLYSGSLAEGNIIGESDALAASSDGEVWAYPKTVKGGGLTIIQSSKSNVFITYSR